MDIVWLDAKNNFNPREIGAKANGLSCLLQLGLIIPRGFVVTVSAFRKFLEGARLSSRLENLGKFTGQDELEKQLQDFRIEIEKASWPPDVQQSIIEAYGILGGKVAVRSSGNVEDGEQSAFAGAFSSFLNRDSETGVLDAIRECWSSAFSPRVAAYRLQHHLVEADWLMGVIVQTMIHADKAGVMFTRNPFEERDTIIVEAVSGGCDRIVSGAPAEFSVRIDRTTRKPEYVELASRIPQRFGTGALGILGSNSLQIPKLLRSREIDTLVSVALRLEEAFHQPQDVEWAITDGQLILLQTRPLTGIKC